MLKQLEGVESLRFGLQMRPDTENAQPTPRRHMQWKNKGLLASGIGLWDDLLMKTLPITHA